VKDELTKIAIKKCSEMIKYSAIGRKKEIFLLLAGKLEAAGAATIPIIRLFRKMIKDEKSRAAYSYNKCSQGNTTGQGYVNSYYGNSGANINITGTSVTSYGGNGTSTTGGGSKFVESTDGGVDGQEAATNADIAAVVDEEFPSGTAGHEGPEGKGPETPEENADSTEPTVGDEVSEKPEPPKEEETKPEIELTLASILNMLCEEKEFMRKLLANVKQYFTAV
jgi:hypothetical protein